METEKVLEVLKPKAASFGFNEEELKGVSKTIAEFHPEEATDEEISKAVDNYLPILKFSQSAANRSIERFKTQFEKDHPKPKTQEQLDAERKAKEEAERKQKEEEERRKKAQQEEPEWFKAYREASEKRIKELEEHNTKMASELANSDFKKKAVAALEGVDESYYNLLLKAQKFEKQEDVDTFVQEVKAGWDEMSKKLKLDSLTKVRPPKTGVSTGDKPSKDVQERIERRKKAQTTGSAIRGLDNSK